MPRLSARAVATARAATITELSALTIWRVRLVSSNKNSATANCGSSKVYYEGSAVLANMHSVT